MSDKDARGRNDPQLQAHKEADRFTLNRESYLEHKKNLLSRFEQQQREIARARGEAITCHAGCTFCCMDNISASLGECEAIVYYLYQHEQALGRFIRQYQEWQERLNDNRTEVNELIRLFDELCKAALSEETREAYLKQAVRYKRRGIPCPFLYDNRCLIYDVRPWVCASITATTPPEWCNPESPNWNKRSIIEFYPEQPVELPFYYGNLKHNIYEVIMPYMVYQILSRAFGYLSTLRGLEGLGPEMMKDPEVGAALKKYQ